MKITLNGEQINIEEGSSVEKLLETYKLAGRRIAVERNLAIVPRSEYAATALTEGDAIEIVKYIGGG